MERLRLRGRIRRPAAEEIRQLAEMEYMNLTEAEVSDLEVLIDRALVGFDRLDELPQPRLEVKYKDRDAGYRPSEDEDPYNAFITKCLVKGAPKGKLAGKKVGIKDNISVAGVRMTCSSRLVEGFTPDVDATVVERLLDAGATIVGKLNMDDFALFPTSETSVFGCCRNPRNPEYSAGGSSGGCGAAVASGDVDIALGVDQGGSARVPAAWCGVICLKPTHGLVPTFGLTYMDHTFDFICPIARTVEEVALTLEAIAGEDPKDPQWVRGPIKIDQYLRTLKRDISGVRIGVLKEAFEWKVTEPDVKEAVLQAVKRLGEMGASIKEVSLPLFRDARPIHRAIMTHGLSAMMESDGEGYWRGGNCNLSWQQAFGRARRVRSHDLPLQVKLELIMGKYLRREYYSTYFSKAQNLRQELREQMNKLLEEVDVLAMPTTPVKAVKLKSSEAADEDKSVVKEDARTWVSINTSPFNSTGHPAITIPCSETDSLPIGLQMAGRHFEESLLLRIAYTYEQALAH